MRYSLFSLVCFFFTSPLQAQDSTRTGEVPKGWKTDAPTAFKPGIRLGFGVQKAFFTDVGLCLYRYDYDNIHGGGYSALGCYTAFEWVPAPKPADVITGINSGWSL